MSYLASKLNEFFALPGGLVEMNDLCGEQFNPIKEKLLIVGACINGDPVAVDITTVEIGFISHDELYKVNKARDVFCVVASSLGDFCRRGILENALPVDYYAAVEERQAI